MKRVITDREIEEILSFITPNKLLPVETANSIVEINKEKLKRQLRNKQIYPHLIPRLREKIEKMYYSSLVQPGESVGIIIAQSIGEKQTQTNLNHFHKAGSSDFEVNVGSRLGELLNATKDLKNPMSIVYFTYNNTNVSNLRKMIGSSMVGITLKKLITKYSFHYSCEEEEEWYTIFSVLYNNNFRKYKDLSEIFRVYSSNVDKKLDIESVVFSENEDWFIDARKKLKSSELRKYNHCIQLDINTDVLYAHSLTFEEIAIALENNYDLACVFSPENIGKFHIFVDTNLMVGDNKYESFDLSKDIQERLYLEEVIFPTLNLFLIAGIKGIKQVFFNKDEKRKGEWLVEIDGSNFPEILQLPFVDKTRTITNSVWDIYETFGIQAARHFMIEQFMQTVSGINICHVMLLVDRMCFSGTIASVTRYTLRNDESGPIGKATFEEPLDILLKAGIYGETENTKGVSASITCGKKATIGTGICDLIYKTN